MPLDFLTHQWLNLLRNLKTPRREAPTETQVPFIINEHAEPPTLTELVQRAAESGDLDATLPGLPPAVADALRAIATGERVPTPLGTEEIAQLGQAVAVWGIPYHRGELSPFGPPFSATKLAEYLGLPIETAQRISAVVHWPIGFLGEDFHDFAGLSEEETQQMLAYLNETHGYYAKGTRYAAP